MVWPSPFVPRNLAAFVKQNTNILYIHNTIQWQSHQSWYHTTIPTTTSILRALATEKARLDQVHRRFRKYTHIVCLFKFYIMINSESAFFEFYFTFGFCCSFSRSSCCLYLKFGAWVCVLWNCCRFFPCTKRVHLQIKPAKEKKSGWWVKKENQVSSKECERSVWFGIWSALYRVFAL